MYTQHYEPEEYYINSTGGWTVLLRYELLWLWLLWLEVKHTHMAAAGTAKIVEDIYITFRRKSFLKNRFWGKVFLIQICSFLAPKNWDDQPKCKNHLFITNGWWQLFMFIYTIHIKLSKLSKGWKRPLKTKDRHTNTTCFPKWSVRVFLQMFYEEKSI